MLVVAELGLPKVRIGLLELSGGRTSFPWLQDCLRSISDEIGSEKR